MGAHCSLPSKTNPVSTHKIYFGAKTKTNPKHILTLTPQSVLEIHVASVADFLSHFSLETQKG